MKTPEEILQQFSKLLDKAFNLFDNFEGDSTYEYANSKWYEKTTRNIINATISLFKKREQQAVDEYERRLLKDFPKWETSLANKWARVTIKKCKPKTT